MQVTVKEQSAIEAYDIDLHSLSQDELDCVRVAFNTMQVNSSIGTPAHEVAMKILLELRKVPSGGITRQELGLL